MTNFEKYFDGLTVSNFGLLGGKVAECSNLSCYNCDFYRSASCNIARMEWLKAEYEELKKINIPKDTPIDTKILVSDDGITWGRRYYAGTMDGIPYVWADGFTSWTSDNRVEPWEYMKLYE